MKPKFVNTRHLGATHPDRFVTGAYDGDELIRVVFWEDGPLSHAVSIDARHAEQALQELTKLIKDHQWKKSRGEL